MPWELTLSVEAGSVRNGSAIARATLEVSRITLSFRISYMLGLLHRIGSAGKITALGMSIETLKSQLSSCACLFLKSSSNSSNE